jgi:F-type H+-transporting ATPase subunit epsilon
MASTFKFELVSPEKVLLSADAEQVVLPGTEGDFAVLAGHAPVIATLRPGILDVQLAGAKRRLYVSGGFAEVEPDRLTVLAPKALDGDKVDASAVRAELAIVEADLTAAKDDETRRLAGEAIDRLKSLT